MKIYKVEINNFRNYYGKHEFILDKDITILYGDNGYGKSSFFDAIEWCITNEIERFKQKDGEFSFSNYDCVNHIAREKEKAICEVSIYYDQYRLCRTYNANTNSTTIYLYDRTLEKEKTIARGQKNVEPYLSKGSIETDEGGRSLIKHSYILSQDQVTNFILSNPKERFDSLASIMGINKITNFIDNLKTYHSALENYHEDLKKEITHKNSILKDRFNERIEYKVIMDRIDKMKGELDHSVIFGGEEEINPDILLSKFTEVSNEILRGQQKLSILDAIPIEYKTYTDLKSHSDRLEVELENQITLLNKVDISENSSIEELISIKNSLSKISKQKDFIKEIEDKRIEIKKLKEVISTLPYEEFDIEKINREFNNCYDYLSRIEYSLLYLKDFNEANKHIIELPKALNENKKRSVLLKKEIERIETEIVVLKNWLGNNDGNNSLQSLLKHLKGIYEYVQINKVRNVCPVCSSNVGLDLDNKINNNLIYYASQISEKELHIMNKIESKEKKEELLSNLKVQYKELENEYIQLENKLEKSKGVINKVIQNEKFDEKLFKSTEQNLSKSKNKVKNQIVQLEQLRDKKNTLSSLEENYNAILKSINIEETDSNIEIMLKKKKNLLIRKVNRLKELKRKVDRKVPEIKNQKNELLSLIKKIEMVNFIYNSSQSFNEIKEDIAKNLVEFRKLEVKYNELRELLIREQEKKETLKVLENYEDEINRLNEELEVIENKKDNLDSYIKHLTSKVGDHALEFLNQPNSKIQQYYRYLNPMPAVNSSIHFVTDNSDEKKRGLSVSIPIEKENGEAELINAKYTLSSAQLNALAISIFLVVNDSQEIGIFDFVAIDDPIQNMDDVNQYTMCDILGDIKKQLIFSTHDLEFLKLFIKKNEYKKEDIRVYFLENTNLSDGKVTGLIFD